MGTFRSVASVRHPRSRSTGAFLIGAFLAGSGAVADPGKIPWDLERLSSPPAFEWTATKPPLTALFYRGESFQGKPTRTFAYYGDPSMFGSASPAPWPGVVLVHGGGGTAFREWVTLWAKRGYAAIAMDLSGMRPDDDDSKKRERLPDGGPDQGHPAKFETIATEDLTDDWPYHAVANVILAHSLLRSFAQVDKDHTALTGISWGGYTTCLVASVDPRFKAAVPVYGCGFLHENSAWLDEFAKLGPENAARWVRLYDPSSHLPGCRVPMFFVNGTNDFAYPLDSHMKSYSAVTKVPTNIRIEVKMPHGHGPGWAPPEIGAFIDSVLLGGPKLPRIGAPEWEGGSVSAAISGGPVASAGVVFSTGDGPVNKLEWQTVGAALDGSERLKPVDAVVPGTARAVFFTAKTASGWMVSSPVWLRASGPSKPAAK